MDTDLSDKLQHRDTCERRRIEQTDHPDAAVTTVHCLDCGAHWPPSPEVTGGLVGRAAGRPG